MRIPSLTGILLLATFPAFAQEAPAPQDAPDTAFEIELNGAADTEASNCRLTFVARNRTGTPLDQVAYEFAVFDTAGRVTQIVAFDFGAMVAGKTRILQFDVGGMACGDVSSIVANDAIVCTVDGTENDGICLSALAARSLTDIQFGI